MQYLCNRVCITSAVTTNQNDKHNWILDSEMNFYAKAGIPYEWRLIFIPITYLFIQCQYQVSVTRP